MSYLFVIHLFNIPYDSYNTQSSVSYAAFMEIFLKQKHTVFSLRFGLFFIRHTDHFNFETAKGWVQYRVSPCESGVTGTGVGTGTGTGIGADIWIGIGTGTGTGTFTSISIYFCQLHSTNAPYSSLP